MKFDDVQIGKQYLRHDKGQKTGDGTVIIPEHNLKVLVIEIDKINRVIHYKHLPNQYNPMGFATTRTNTRCWVGDGHIDWIEFQEATA